MLTRGPRPKNITNNYYNDIDIHMGTLEVIKCIVSETCQFFPEINPTQFGQDIYNLSEVIFCRIPGRTRECLFKNNYPIREKVNNGYKNLWLSTNKLLFKRKLHSKICYNINFFKNSPNFLFIWSFKLPTSMGYSARDRLNAILQDDNKHTTTNTTTTTAATATATDNYDQISSSTTNNITTNCRIKYENNNNKSKMIEYIHSPIDSCRYITPSTAIDNRNVYNHNNNEINSYNSQSYNHRTSDVYKNNSLPISYYYYHHHPNINPIEPYHHYCTTNTLNSDNQSNLQMYNIDYKSNCDSFTTLNPQHINYYNNNNTTATTTLYPYVQPNNINYNNGLQYDRMNNELINMMMDGRCNDSSSASLMTPSSQNIANDISSSTLINHDKNNNSIICGNNPMLPYNYYFHPSSYITPNSLNQTTDDDIKSSTVSFSTSLLDGLNLSGGGDELRPTTTTIGSNYEDQLNYNQSQIKSSPSIPPNYNIYHPNPYGNQYFW